MHEQIKKLYDQAWAETTDHYGTMQKFAELIVQECVRISRTSTDGFNAGRRMEEHFGVSD